MVTYECQCIKLKKIIKDYQNQKFICQNNISLFFVNEKYTLSIDF